MEGDSSWFPAALSAVSCIPGFAWPWPACRQGGADPFTGYVTNDFNPTTNPNVNVTPVSSDPMNIGQSQWITNNGWVSGWSIKDIRTYYDQSSDTLYVGVNTFANPSGSHAPFGQANGDPKGTADRLRPGPSGRRQVDRPGLCTDQSEQHHVTRIARW